MNVRDEIARISFKVAWEGFGGKADLKQWDNVSDDNKEPCYELADAILSHPRIAILAEDQSEPDILQRDRDTLDPEDYQYAQGVRYMWNAHFRRIEKD